MLDRLLHELDAWLHLLLLPKLIACQQIAASLNFSFVFIEKINRTASPEFSFGGISPRLFQMFRLI
jgi:hypothetical protein